MLHPSAACSAPSSARAPAATSGPTCSASSPFVLVLGVGLALRGPARRRARTSRSRSRSPGRRNEAHPTVRGGPGLGLGRACGRGRRPARAETLLLCLERPRSLITSNYTGSSVAAFGMKSNATRRPSRAPPPTTSWSRCAARPRPCSSGSRSRSGRSGSTGGQRRFSGVRPISASSPPVRWRTSPPTRCASALPARPRTRDRRVPTGPRRAVPRGALLRLPAPATALYVEDAHAIEFLAPNLFRTDCSRCRRPRRRATTRSRSRSCPTACCGPRTDRVRAREDRLRGAPGRARPDPARGVRQPHRGAGAPVRPARQRDLPARLRRPAMCGAWRMPVPGMAGNPGRPSALTVSGTAWPCTRSRQESFAPRLVSPRNPEPTLGSQPGKDGGADAGSCRNRPLFRPALPSAAVPQSGSGGAGGSAGGPSAGSASGAGPSGGGGSRRTVRHRRSGRLGRHHRVGRAGRNRRTDRHYRVAVRAPSASLVRVAGGRSRRLATRRPVWRARAVRRARPFRRARGQPQSLSVQHLSLGRSAARCVLRDGGEHGRSPAGAGCARPEPGLGRGPDVDAGTQEPRDIDWRVMRSICTGC